MSHFPCLLFGIKNGFVSMFIGELYNRGEKIDSSKFGADPGMSKEVTISSKVEASPNGVSKSTAAYRCKKCRRVVALQENVVDHVPGEGETSFEWYKRRSGNPFDKPCESDCSSFFVEPLRWMTTGKNHLTDLFLDSSFSLTLFLHKAVEMMNP